ncbi:MAG: hypothetical protein E7A11_13230 [Clostridium sp.]|uniref:tetratricopeptide repeat protein n=1 Tax=Clostridium sp. TaxID=1506 RepID=UPI002903A33B|nr:hypothetical protein [Clostridium sp.]MDU1126235.1 hypothetical protein [Clostridium sp.]
MGIIDKLKKRKIIKEEVKGEENIKEETIECYDAYGRKIVISKSEWKTKILPDQLKKYKNDDNALYNIILSSINDGFIDEVVESAEYLKEIDRIKERGYTILAIVYMKLLQYDKSEKVLLEYIDKYGKTGTILTNLAKVYYGQGHEDKGLNTLWEGIYLDPNQTNGLMWLKALYNEKEGKEAEIKVLDKVSKVSGSWFPQVLIGKMYLDNKEIDKALKEYESIMEIVKDNGYALSMISGDLGASGYADIMVRMMSPIYKLDIHGIDLGMNLLRGYLVTKDIENGEKLLSTLLKLERPDLKNYLMNIYNEFEKMKGESTGEELGEISISLPTYDSPLWYYSLGEPTWLLPKKSQDCKKVIVLAYANEGIKEESKGHIQREESIGRLTRTIKDVGPIVSRKVYEDDYIKDLLVKRNGDYMVTGGIREEEDSIYIESYIYDKFDNKLKISKNLNKISFGSEFNEMIKEIIDSLKVELVYCGEYYKTPKDNLVSLYIQSLAQLLSQSLVKNEYCKKDSLWGERNILNWYLNIAVENRDYPHFKLILLSGIAAAKEYGSSIYLELKNEVLTLFKEKDELGLSEKMMPLVYKIYDMATEFEDCRKDLILKNSNDSEYTKWLQKL